MVTSFVNVVCAINGFAHKNKLALKPISRLIIHQIFSLARNWSKHNTWPNIPQLKLQPCSQGLFPGLEAGREKNLFPPPFNGKLFNLSNFTFSGEKIKIQALFTKTVEH